MIRLEAIDIMEEKETTTQNFETGRSPNTIYWLSVFVGSTCSWNTLAAMITDDCFLHSNLHKCVCNFPISNVVVGVHSENDIVAIVAEVSKKLAEISDE